MHTITLSDAQLALVHAALDDAAELRTEYPNDECHVCDSMYCEDYGHKGAPRVEHLYTTLRRGLPQTSTALYNVTTADALADVTAPHADLTFAIGEMAGTMARVDDGAEGMTCCEVDSIATVLVYGGYQNAAASLIRCHAPGDYDEDDRHHELYVVETDTDAELDDRQATIDAARDIALTYVAAL